jgi:hypothetical protein
MSFLIGRLSPVSDARLLEQLIPEASQLPLKDAAFLLWRHKFELDREEFPRPPPDPTIDPTDPAVFAPMVRSIMATLLRERQTAHDGPTFGRMKKAHPEAGDAEIKQAITAAVKFDTDCTSFFSYRSADYSDDLTRAIEQAKARNPGFLQSTYKAARLALAVAMR